MDFDEILYLVFTRNLRETIILAQELHIFITRALTSKLKFMRNSVVPNYSWGTATRFYFITALQPFVGPWPLFQFLTPAHS
jgi:hypothetical protein